MANEPNTITWVDLGTSDLEGAKSFYGALFGWTPETDPDPQTMGYTNFYLDGKRVAAAGPLMGDEQPVAWSMYVATDDADAVQAKVEKAGGKVLAPAMDVLAYGRMGFFTDQAGAPFGVWQPGTHGGAQIMGPPNSLNWTELTTRDVAGSKAFYGAVFGWTGDDTTMGEGVPYTVWKSDGMTVAGMMPMEGDMWPADLPPHWMVYFAVEDCDAAASKIEQLGGSVSIPPTDTPPGRLAVVADPQGATFSVIATDPDFVPTV